ncbi:rCG55305 [Rattus norvegicus]|uniref:RCG55305 n=1 Tax=Rattus norvegicus TaxID=10116 RepID=A6KF34_RAT|nr:rCG55305 [Rattus norvegicus]
MLSPGTIRRCGPVGVGVDYKILILAAWKSVCY